MRIYIYTLLILLSLLFAQSLVAKVYKYTDANGIIYYTNNKPTGHSFKVLTFPCYAGSRKCGQISWENVRLMPTKYANLIELAAAESSVDAALIRAIIHAESAFNPEAESPKGAQGLMQLMPFNQQRLGVSNPFLPEQNIPGGAKHLAELYSQFGDDFDRVVAAYNAGAGAVNKYDGVPPFAETVEYLRRVKILYRRYGSL